ncbi:MAG: lecithin retinol acyltransferase family protein [Candidatus Pelagibacter bacterium]|jgi:hypothetical protein|nr:lecithin retinol acyltransferase family protein [Candidatus Pelagibacter bacterium]|tara:strand:+ start:461 stop:910 length:450 start_codon:yes stop_codon:yes gene_type:complete
MNKQEYLKAITKKTVIKNLKTGDLVKVKADLLPFLYHYGVTVKDEDEMYIYHFQPDRKNKLGGNLLREKLKDYIKGKEIISVVKSNIDESEIRQVLEKLKKEKYNVFSNNCEHFVNFIKEKKFISPQLKNWGLIISLSIATYLILSKKK